jgi:hypothetical protein
LTKSGVFDIMKEPPKWEAGRALQSYGRRFGYILREEVELMRITFHVGDFTVTIMIKRRRNRHSAK